jgi:hypothetical protein
MAFSDFVLSSCQGVALMKRRNESTRLSDSNAPSDPNEPSVEEFFWHKKRELDAQRGMTREELAAWERERRLHNQNELERIRRAREERDTVWAQKVEERDQLQRQKEREALGTDWEEKERLFHLKQSFLKVYKRVEESYREQEPMDLLLVLALPCVRLTLVSREYGICYRLKNVRIGDELSRCTAASIDNLKLEELFLAHDSDSLNREYWDAVMGYFDKGDDASLSLVKMNATAAVAEDVTRIFGGKTLLQLLELEKGVLKKLSDPTCDTDYWSELRERLQLRIKCARLDDAYQRLQERLAAEAKLLKLDFQDISLSDALTGRIRLPRRDNASADSGSDTGAKTVQTNFSNEVKVRNFEADTCKDAKLDSINGANNAIGTGATGNASNQFRDSNDFPTDNCIEAMNMWEYERSRHVGPDELPFNAEAENIPFKQPRWLERADPSKPLGRVVKPRFFNRVRMNYEWNTYNQTHYDTDNPPPKVVQGFRFNVFYPRLQSGHTPDYRVEADSTGNAETRILRFTAGHPYADVCFRVPADEWDKSSKHGFKCIFEKGALRLHFWFRSQRYRR